jgi:Excalibur calcium-binding domain
VRVIADVRTHGPRVRRLVIIVILGLLGWQGYQHYQARTAKTAALPESSTAPVPAALSSPVAQYKCDGRTYCSQMTSCEEATYFLRNCPGVKMDGNNDGVPCEQQWCRR